MIKSRFKLRKVRMPGICQICGNESYKIVNYSFLMIEVCEECASKVSNEANRMKLLKEELEDEV